MFVDGFMKARLGEIFEIGSGGTPSKKNPEYYNGNIPWIKTGDLKEKYLYKSEDYITELGLNNSSAKMCEPDTVLIAMYGATIGATSILKIPACTNQACATFKKSDKITPEFLYYFFRSQKERFVKDGVGGAQPNISAGYLKKIEIELLPLKKQNEITNTLDKLQSIITHLRTQLEKLDLLVKARFVELFGDYHTNNKGFESHKGKDLFKFSSGRFLSEEKRFEKGIPVYGGNGIAWYTEKPLIDYPTIIIGRVGAWCGNIHTIYEPVWITDNAIYIKEQKTSKFTLEFLAELMKIMDFRQYADFSGQPKITQKPLETLEYLTPPINMQNEFTEFCKQIEKSKSILQQELTQTQTLFDSLMQEYFG